MKNTSIKGLQRNQQIIDLNGPEGNAFFLLGIAMDLAEKLGKDGEDIRARMESSDYDNLIEVFKAEFGIYVILIG